MKRDETTPVLSAIFVDYDNIYMSLKRKSDEAAKRFAKLSQDWLKGIETGSLITATNGVLGTSKRRIVMNRCYGNPVPRRNAHDNSTDMNSFPFVRHHFLRAGCEVVDCPPLTAQLKNSSDIRMVMDIRDYLTHDTYFDEFIILSGDADFTPVLQRLRQHARRTIIFCNEYTAQPYTAICDGEVREADLIALLMAQEPAALPAAAPSGDTGGRGVVATPATAPSVPSLRQEIIGEVMSSVLTAATPVPLEALADRALRVLGHEKTVNTSWAGAGSFRELLRQSLPAEVQLTDTPPYYAFDPKRHTPASMRAPAMEPQRQIAPQMQEQARMAPPPSIDDAVFANAASQPAPRAPQPEPHLARSQQPLRTAQSAPAAAQPVAQRPAPPSAMLQPQPTQLPSATQQSIARIYEACQAPALAPAEYRAVFEVLAQEINENSLAGTQTLANVIARAQQRGLDLKRDDARFILEVVSEADPWFDQGASATLFGGRFRNFVVARCRSQGLSLTADELDLIDSWFAGAPPAQSTSRAALPPQPAVQASAPAGEQRTTSRWWPGARAAESAAEPAMATGDAAGEDFPRIIRTRR